MGPVETSNEKRSLVQLAAIRRNVWNAKASHPRLVRMEVLAHQIACEEYNIDILKHLIDLENGTRSSWASFQSQPELNVQMRALIFDFIMCCHTRLGLSSSTLFLCYNIIDRYCSKIIVKSPTYQLVGLTALWLASKFADKKPRIPSLQTLCCHQYTKKQFKEMELHILQSLNWSVCSAPTHDSFVDILVRTKIAKLNYQSLNLKDLKYGATILCELSCFDPNLNYNYNSSAIALASVILITCALKLNRSNIFQDYRACTSDQNLIVICGLLLKQLKNGAGLPPSFKLKYSTRGGDLQSNPYLGALLAYQSRILAEQRTTYDNISYLRSPCIASPCETGNMNCKDDLVLQRGATPLECMHSDNFGQLPAKSFVPPTPTTPSTFTSNQLAPTVKILAPTLLAPGSATIGQQRPKQHEIASPVNDQFRIQPQTAKTKRATSMLDLDFFSMDQIVVKRMR